MTEYSDVELLARADPLKIVSKYSHLGLAKRIRWLVESMKIIEVKYNSKIPSTYDELDDMPGVGNYTANAILCFAFNKRVEIVDTNVMRLYGRVFNIAKEEVKMKAQSILPSYKWREFNEALLDFSSLVCKKIGLCDKCPIHHMCSFFIRGV